MMTLFINFLNPKSKNEKIELSVQPHTKDSFASSPYENHLTTTAPDYLPYSDFQIVFGNSIYDIQFVGK